MDSLIKKLNYNNVLYTEWRKEDLLSAGVPLEVVDSAIVEQQRVEIEISRRNAYLKESDPLYIEWQYELSVDNSESEKFKQAWLLKVQQIKNRYPLLKNTQPAA
ncbi:hypothetical protein JC606_17950 [Vibrio sp. IB15]|uniref:hypothetical protein n=1 Tax=Vibrio sp. IB15 TaxID=2779368 RepID=UPI0018E8DD69|nr:hypothetical protein [Vibrio sp. IB15]MBJ2148244.1 hypothetical protein [Vibrio sp. IB15]